MKKWILGFAVVSCALYGEPKRFVFLGDTGHGDAAQYSVATGIKSFCENKKCEFGILLGDNFYPKGVKSAQDPQWKKAFEIPYLPLKFPFYAVLGNHDYEGSVDAQLNYSKTSRLWKLPSRYYTFSHASAQFFMLDTTAWNKAQGEWLKAELGKSTARWKFVAGHHPIYSYGKHGNTDVLVKELRPLLLGKVDFYLCGHDHDKQVLKDPQDQFLFYIVSGTGSDSRPVQGGPLSLFHSAILGFSSFSFDAVALGFRMHRSDGKKEFARRFEHRP